MDNRNTGVLVRQGFTRENRELCGTHWQDERHDLRVLRTDAGFVLDHLAQVFRQGEDAVVSASFLMGGLWERLEAPEPGDVPVLGDRIRLQRTRLPPVGGDE